MNETELMELARQAIKDEDSARLNAKAAELATADEAARLAAAKEAHTEELKAAAEEAMNAEGVTLSDLARKFDAAVAALADLATAACTRNEVIGRHASGIQAAGLREAERTPAPELLARALALAANQVATPGNGLKNLASGVLAYSGPLHRATAVERAAR
ncbi:hypothetical protein I6J39_26430 [Streptomyces californicus]|uniref:Uncharacterized protein n=1 Tax=Streptomyces californicus TaxID=67351 RepID=A0ABX7J937_9ACTN|nr:MULTISPECIES: hypothetical protein [Streptomyces]QRV30439.1 hypothetical protein I6J39_26430 [Streptomyces californicus]QRV43854.1 hypothetical protein I6J41_26360 [Streptomyces californicus]